MDNLIGLKIRKVREIKNFSQGYVADKLSVSQSTYSDIENGKQIINKEKLAKIASILDVSPETIENFSEQIVFNSCNQSGFSNTYHITNPIEKINALYEDLIIQLKERITSLESVVDAKNEVIDLLKKK
jgi:transcriptional regulator with XRE-family HTH domain